VLLLDTSASMAAADGADATSTSAFAQATKALEQQLEAVPVHVDLRVGTCGPHLQIWRGPRPELRARLLALRPSGRNEVDMADLARRLTSPTRAVLTLTDGRATVPRDGALRVFGAAAPNLAITACRIDDAWPLPEIVVRVTVQNFGPARAAAVQVVGAVEPLSARGLSLQADAVQEVEFTARRADGGTLSVQLRGAEGGPWRDALGLDDAVDIAVPPPPRPQIALRSEGPVHPALDAAARTLAAECGGRVVSGDEVEQAGFLLLDGGRLAGVPQGVRMLSFGTALGGDPTPTTGPSVVDWNRTDPVTAGLDLSELRVDAALRFGDELGVALIQGSEGPLGVAIPSRAGACTVHLGFRLGESNLFKLAAFPQLVRRALARAYGPAGAPVIGAGAMLDAVESDLRGSPGPAVDRPLPEFDVPPQRLAVPLLVFALLLLAIRAYV
jgi:hypothetical protein